MKKRKIIATSLIILATIVIIAMVLLPGFVRKYTVNNSKELLGRQIQINKLKLNYFTGNIEINDFIMYEKDETTPFVSFDTLILNLEPYGYFNSEVIVEKFYLQGLVVNTLVKDSIFNFDDLIEFHSRESDTLAQEDSELLKYSLSNLELKEAEFIFDNRNVDKVTDIEKFSFFIPFIGWDQNDKSTAGLKFNFKKGGFLESNLNVNHKNGDFDAQIQIQDLSLEPFTNYVKEYAEINNFEGRFSAKIEIIGNTYEAVNSIVTGLVELNDFYITDKNNKTFLSSKKVNANLNIIDYANANYIIDSLIINEPYTYFQIDSLTNSFSQIFKLNNDTIASEVAINKTVKDSTLEKPLSYAVNYIGINKGVLDLSEGVMVGPIDYHFSEINSIIYGVSSTSDKIEIQANLLLDDEAFATTVTEINPQTFDFQSQLKVNDLSINKFYPYTTEYANINSLEGIANSDIVIKGNVDEYMKSLISGHVEIDNFEMTDKEGAAFLKSKNIDCTIREADVEFTSMNLKSLVLKEPYVYFEMDSITNNYFKIFNYIPESVVSNDTLSSNQKTIASTDDSLFYNIDSFSIINGVMDYRDNLTGEPFDYHLSSIKIDADKINSAADWIKINSEMILNNRGNLVAELGYNPNDTNYLNLDLSVENFLLPDLNIYTNYYMGHNILVGDMYYYSNSVITAGNIESENKLLLKNVSIKNNKKGIYALPLKFALFLLTDKNGDVNLDIPVRGDLNDPSLNVGKIVWSAFKNLIVKLATSPGRLLAGLVGGPAEDIETIQFKYSDTIPSDKNIKQLDKILTLEEKKEGLKIEMVYYTDKELQKKAIAREILGKMYFTETSKEYLKNEEEFEDFIKLKAGSDSLETNEAINILVPTKTVDSLALVTKAQIIKSTSDYLIKVNPNTKIIIKESDPLEPENVGSPSQFKIKYDMIEDEINIKKDTIN